jgi:hypothetical protein
MPNRKVCIPYPIPNFEDEFQYPIPDMKGIPILHPRPEKYIIKFNTAAI